MPHTPRPWTVGVSVDALGWPVFRLREMQDPDPDGQEVRGDRLLIEAAPDLLAECRRIHDRIASEIGGPLLMSEREHDDYVRLARVIAKAEGKPDA